MEELTEAWNLVVSSERRLAWTSAPICLADVFLDADNLFDADAVQDADLISPSEGDSRELHVEPNPQRKQLLEIQSRPDDMHLFPAPPPTPPSPKPAPKPLSPIPAKIKPTTPGRAVNPISMKHGTIRVYAHSISLTQPLTEQEVKPSVITVERAALCQIFLETKYHRTFQQPSERTQRRQTLEELVTKGKEMTVQQRTKFNAIMTSVESDWSRLSRVRPSIEGFSVEKKLGSGGFGVVNMVKEKGTGEVYAMKSIAKEKTLRCGHEGRVLCERDLLKRATESGSNWICKLHCAFQDAQALSSLSVDLADCRHLVLEYMPGGDFLLLLLKKAPLSETDTCFYLAEMINAIDACHKLGFMHRDVKPDNFLVSASGHLKIADFGLATSGEWIYQESYRSSRRKDLLRKYHKSIISDGAEESLASASTKAKDAGAQPPGMGFLDQQEKWKKMHADSVVGTYYYMAPEVLQGESYNATADWWSLGIILFECLFGYPPFWASTRRATQKVIMDWIHTLEIPLEPRTSQPIKNLIRSLLTSAPSRLRTPTWEIDLPAQQGQQVTVFQRNQVFKRDVRNHPFFRSAQIDFESVHLGRAPWVPGCVEVSREGGEAALQGTEKPVRTKDVMLLDDRVLKERSRSAFKNFTYRGRDLGGVLKRFAEALQDEDVE